jgi:hypothetical protein
VDARQNYSLEEIAALLRMDVATIRKWHDIGFIAEGSSESRCLALGEDRKVAGKDLVCFLGSVHASKTLFDKSHELQMVIASAIALVLAVLLGLLSDEPLSVIAVLLVWLLAIISLIAVKEAGLKNYSRIGLGFWRSSADPEKGSISVDIRAKLKRRRMLLLFWLGMVLFLLVFRGRLFDRGRFHYNFEQYFIAAFVFLGWWNVLAFLLEQTMYNPRGSTDIKPKYENRIARRLILLLGLGLLAGGLIYFCGQRHP